MFLYFLQTIREILLLGHRQAFAWIDDWISMTIADVRTYECEMQRRTNTKVNACDLDTTTVAVDNVTPSSPRSPKPLSPLANLFSSSSSSSQADQKNSTSWFSWWPASLFSFLSISRIFFHLRKSLLSLNAPPPRRRSDSESETMSG